MRVLYWSHAILCLAVIDCAVGSDSSTRPPLTPTSSSSVSTLQVTEPAPQHNATEVLASATDNAPVESTAREQRFGSGVPVASEEPLNDASTEGPVDVEAKPEPVNPMGRGYGPAEGDMAPFGMVNLTKPPQMSANAPKLHLGVARIQGGLNTNVVRRILQRGGGAITNCYSAVLIGAPNAQGKLELSFDIDEAGSVAVVRVLESDFSDPSMNSCLVSAMSALTFPRPSKAPAKVTLPVRFSR